MSRDSEAETAEKEQHQQPETAAPHGKSEKDSQPDSDSLGVGPLLDALALPSSASSSPLSVPALSPVSPVSPLSLLDLSSESQHSNFASLSSAHSASSSSSASLPLSPPPLSHSTNAKANGKAKSRKGKQKVTKELPATQTSKHANLTHDIRKQAKHIASQLPAVWSAKEEEVKALDKTMSFVPGQSGSDFNTAVEASQIYVQQSRFGRKIDVYTRASVIPAICDKGLLRIGHSLNPSKATDEGWFGDPHFGVNVTPYVDYSLKYANDLDPLRAGEEVSVIMCKVLPGRAKHIAEMKPGIRPTECAESQVCPIYILRIRAFIDTRTHNDDAKEEVVQSVPSVSPIGATSSVVVAVASPTQTPQPTAAATRSATDVTSMSPSSSPVSASRPIAASAVGTVADSSS